jgi:hypothetical protein
MHFYFFDVFSCRISSFLQIYLHFFVKTYTIEHIYPFDNKYNTHIKRVKLLLL